MINLRCRTTAPINDFTERTGEEGAGNTTSTAGYAWHFTCDLHNFAAQQEWQKFICFLNKFVLHLSIMKGYIVFMQLFRGNQDFRLTSYLYLYNNLT